MKARWIMYMAITIIYVHIHQMDTWHRLKRDIPINDFFQCECYKNAWPSHSETFLPDVVFLFLCLIYLNTHLYHLLIFFYIKKKMRRNPNYFKRTYFQILLSLIAKQGKAYVYTFPCWYMCIKYTLLLFTIITSAQ